MENVTRIQFCKIVIDNSINVRAMYLVSDVVHRYAECIDALPPVSVFRVGSEFMLVDGWHRIAARNINGLKAHDLVEVRIVGEGTIHDARDFSDLANMAHGLPLTMGQRNQVIKRLNERHPSWSQLELSGLVGVGVDTVSRILACNEVEKHETKISNPSQVLSDFTTIFYSIKRFLARIDEPSKWADEDLGKVKTKFKPIAHWICDVWRVDKNLFQ